MHTPWAILVKGINHLPQARWAVLRRHGWPLGDAVEAQLMLFMRRSINVCGGACLEATSLPTADLLCLPTCRERGMKGKSGAHAARSFLPALRPGGPQQPASPEPSPASLLRKPLAGGFNVLGYEH